MSNANNKPPRGPKHRTRAFQDYLDAQSPERAREIIAAERVYGELRNDPGSTALAAERDYLESLKGCESKIKSGLEGYETPLPGTI